VAESSRDGLGEVAADANAADHAREAETVTRIEHPCVQLGVGKIRLTPFPDQRRIRPIAWPIQACHEGVGRDLCALQREVTAWLMGAPSS
jgi:hypothetical protein